MSNFNIELVRSFVAPAELSVASQEGRLYDERASNDEDLDSVNWQVKPKPQATIQLATSPAWSSLLVREFAADWPFEVTSLNKLKNCGHLVGNEFFVVQPEGDGGIEVARLVAVSYTHLTLPTICSV